jgi:hypothetical protein
MRTSLVFVALAASLACAPAFAEEEKKADADNPLLKGSFFVGFSYPLVLSASLGAVLPFDARDRKYPIATRLALRADGEIGLGGGSVGAGLYMPVKEYFVVNVKAVRMRTWLLTWNEDTGRTFTGPVVELALPTAHGGPKIGIGRLKDTELRDGTRRSFIYVFLGAGL